MKRSSWHTGRLACMKRILTVSDTGNAPFVDWMVVWAQAGLTLYAPIDCK